jgi:uncharacterized protein YndB with AHSA1/START domain
MRLHVEASGTSRAPAVAVWALLADANSYCRWGPWSGSGYEGRRGPTSGVGTIRWMRYGRTTTVEEILEVENNKRMTYTVVSGIPVRNYVAEVTLTSTERGTYIHWNADWDRTLPGRVVHKKLRLLYPEIVANLISAADQRGSFPFSAPLDGKR